MYRNVNQKIRECIYGVLCQSNVCNNKVNLGNGTAFMIAPGICATAAHVLHIEKGQNKTSTC
jgi:hypothetical protein